MHDWAIYIINLGIRLDLLDTFHNLFQMVELVYLEGDFVIGRQWVNCKAVFAVDCFFTIGFRFTLLMIKAV